MRPGQDVPNGSHKPPSTGEANVTNFHGPGLPRLILQASSDIASTPLLVLPTSNTSHSSGMKKQENEEKVG